MSRRVSQDYDRLRDWIVAAARQDLRDLVPEYVSELQRVLVATGGNLEFAMSASAKHLRKPLPKWPPLLTALFDLEFVRGKVVNCHELLRRSSDDASSDSSFWFLYHLDHWTFQADAFMDRCDRLFKQVIRAVIRPLDANGWQAFERDVATQMRALKTAIAAVRDPLAHGLGGGVAGLIDRWEPMLAAPMNVFDGSFVKSAVGGFESAVEIKRRRMWFRAAHRANLLLFAYSEAISRQLLDRIEALVENAAN